MYASQNAAHRPASAELTQCLRVGSPPYRFTGRCLASNRVALCGTDVSLFIDLWERRRGGYTIAFSRWIGDAWCPDACNVPTLEAAMDLMEEICTTQDVSCHASVGDASLNLVDQIAQTAVLYDQLTLFQQLAGRALDGWTDLEALT